MMASTARSGRHAETYERGAHPGPLLGLLVLAALWAGCSATYPEGKIICDDTAECPSGFVCRARDEGDQRFCFTRTAPDRSDSGPPPGTSMDTAADGGDGATENSEVVGPEIDGGPAPSPGGSGGAGTAGAANTDAMDGPSDAGRCADASAECEPGASEVEMMPCGPCNSGAQRATRSCGADCRWGPLEPSGQCRDVTAVCAPGDEKPESRECECGRSQSRTLTCSDRCTWSDAAWGACDLSGVQCEPGETQMQTVACASCGTRTQKRSCAANSCTWGSWSDLSSACASSCEDCSEVQFCEAPANQPNPGGTKCRQTLRACTREQALADCQADIPVVCGTVQQPFHMQYL